MEGRKAGSRGKKEEVERIRKEGKKKGGESRKGERKEGRIDIRRKEDKKESKMKERGNCEFGCDGFTGVLI